jgi:hypothetical protein
VTNRLLRYEAVLMRRGFADAFARRRDQLLLAVVLLLAVLWLRDRASAGLVRPLPRGALWLALLTVVPAFASQRHLAARLGWLAEHSVIADAALRPQTRAGYLALAYALIAAPLLAAAVWLGLSVGRPFPTIGVAAAAALVGVAAANLPLRLDARRGVGGSLPRSASHVAGRRAVLRSIVARQTIGSHPAGAAVTILALVFGLTLAVCLAGRGEPELLATLLALLPLAAALVIVSRIDASLCAFLPFAGYGPAFVGTAVGIMPVACGIAAAVALSLARTASIALLAAAALTGLAVIVALARAWLYPGRQRRAVDLQLQIELAALVLIGVLALPLAALVLLWRLATFYRRSARTLWMQS